MSNREEWLMEATKLFREKVFCKPNRRLPAKLAVSCGIPKGSSAAIGQCWDSAVTKDGTTHVFVCPSQEDSCKVLAVLAHELVHASVGVSQGHGTEFGRVARSIGLEGKLTSTEVSSKSPLWPKLQEIVERLGDYPHRALNKNFRPAKRPSPPKRLKVFSPQDESFAFFLQEQLIEEFGMPKDPWGNEMIAKGDKDA